MDAANIVILGGGVGGTLVANLLARKLTRKQARVTLIDRTGKHCYQPGWLYVPFGGTPPERLERDERRLLARGVQLVVGDAARVDTGTRCVELADGRVYPFDYLVLATGACLAPDALPGYNEAAHHFYSAEAALRLHAALREFEGGKILVGAADLLSKCPPAPLEFAFMLDDYLRQRGIREQTEITYFSPLGRVFTIESVAEFVAPLMHERGIDYELCFNVASVDGPGRRLHAAEGKSLAYDLLVMVPPHRGAPVISASGLGDSLGWVPTDRETLQSLADPAIFALGDAADLPVSKSGAAAHFEGRVVASRIYGAIIGAESSERYSGMVMFFLETGYNQATQLIFDYHHPPQPPRPSAYYHYEKALLNRAYWHLVPSSIM